MRHRSKKAQVSVLIGLTATEVLGPNPLRKCLLFNPLPGMLASGLSQMVVAVQFTQGLLQNWQVPSGVTQLIDGYLWGCGGNGDVGQAVNGGGGGGGGGFSTTGPLALTPGSSLQLNLQVHNNVTISSILGPTGTTLASANGGVGAVASGGGAGGAVGTGALKVAGGTGFTAATAPGGGGGGSGGNLGAGGTSVGQAGGAAGGGAVLLGFGAGAIGGAGGNANVSGNPGIQPGSGGGGGGATTGGKGNGADAFAVLFYQMSAEAGGITIDQNPNVLLGQGVININGQTIFPILIDDTTMGTQICDPWYAVSGIANVVFNSLDISYDCQGIERAF